tara:strand:+ start:113 stop:442 length:330 start_codon:yes stop_codon:yes gene_type:complete
MCPRDSQCYYARVNEICGNEGWLTQYYDMFAKGYQDQDDLHEQFASAFGDSFAYQDPTLLALMQATQVSDQSGPDLTEREHICSSQAFASSLTLEMLIQSCFFALAESL